MTCRRLSPIEALDVADLALAEDENARRLEVLVKAGQGEAGLLDVRTGDDAGGARLTAQAAPPTARTPRQRPSRRSATVTVGRVMECRTRARGQASGSIRPRCPSGRRNSTVMASVARLRKTRNASAAAPISSAASSIDSGFTA